MRKALLALGLIAASFAGGAAANGPALAWVRARIGLGIPSADDTDITLSMVGGLPDDETRPAGPGRGDEPADPASAPPSPSIPFLAPTGPDPSVPDRQGLASTESSDPSGAGKPGSESEPTPVRPGLPVLTPRPEPPSPPPVSATTPRSEPPSLPSLVGPTAAANPTPTPTPGRADLAVARTLQSLIHPKAQASENESEAPKTPEPSVPPVAMPAAATGSWTEMTRRMSELGVRRYWLEGEPGGRVRFRCVIPLAGDHAVGQQFEAEGASEAQAVETALKRIALWKAVSAPRE